MGQKNKGRPKRFGSKPRPSGGGGAPQGASRGDRQRGPQGEHKEQRPGRRHRGADRPPRNADRSPRGADGARPRPPGDGAPNRSAPQGEQRAADAQHARPERLWIYGRHAAIAALANPKRRIKRILANDSALEWIGELGLPRDRLASLTSVSPAHLDAALHAGAVHQGIAVEVEDLPRTRLREDCKPDGVRPIVVLDQITDPHNIGAIIRSAAAFNARAIIVQDRRTPPLAGALAKAAAGAVEIVPCVQVVNIARALEGLKALGYFCAGLAGESAAPIASLPAGKPVALVLGAEGAGLRKLVRESCDGVYAIPIARGVDSLNVSTAAAVALYEIARPR